ncbi:RDD family protein [Roseateles chitosanitabidus]|uniref:RDD family protein n=1 Tax=Roseateles chitosanitabidus TaxID=65048 RepID=UPI0008370786|nr:RDD family protein [Roseateles chitosanitabidus]MBO9688087.1 RDD family protein [Roseateles chitosanitabidus]
MTSAPFAASDVPPALMRRMASFLYEGVVLFGVVFVAGWLYSTLTQQRHALNGHQGLQAFLFMVLGIYFIWFWSRGGQTVAMRAWHLRVVDQQGRPLTQMRALGRYLASWLWFLPALASIHLLDVDHSSLVIFGALFGGVLAYLLLARLHPQRQFLHDVICGTRLITQRPPARAAKPGSTPVDS